MLKLNLRQMKKSQSGTISAIKTGGELATLVFQIGTARGLFAR